MANKPYSSFAYKFETAPISGRSFWGCLHGIILGLLFYQEKRGDPMAIPFKDATELYRKQSERSAGTASRGKPS